LVALRGLVKKHEDMKGRKKKRAQQNAGAAGELETLLSNRRGKGLFASNIPCFYQLTGHGSYTIRAGLWQDTRPQQEDGRSKISEVVWC
jgi:hypothetical protein